MAVHSIIFMPPSSGDILVTCSYEALITASLTPDWSNTGNSAGSIAFVSQGASYIASSRRGMSATRETQTVQVIASVLKGVEVEAGLDAALRGFTSCRYFNVQIKVELAKR